MSGARATRALVPHPDHPTSAVRGIAVDVTRTADGLDVTWTLECDPDAICVPAPAEPAFVLGLWQHTCFELFVAADDAPAYHEYNLAPSGAWAAFAFRSHRDGEPLLDAELAPRIAVRRETGRLLLDAHVPLARLSPAYARARLRLALTAVVEDARGACSYWSLRHPPGAADFHSRDGFALVLET